MTQPDICVGPAFRVDSSGNLQVRIAGLPDTVGDEPWPYPSQPDAENGLRLDQSRGLWVPPPAIVVQDQNSLVDARDFIINQGGTRASPEFNLTIANPSPSYDLTYRVSFSASWFGAIGTNCEPQAGIRASINDPISDERPTKTPSPANNSWSWFDTDHAVMQHWMPPGGSAVVRMRTRWWSPVGDWTLQYWIMSINFFGVCARHVFG